VPFRPDVFELVPQYPLAGPVALGEAQKSIKNFGSYT